MNRVVVNYQSEPVTIWFDRRLVMSTSTIHGIGTFATHEIDVGELLMFVTGGLLVRAEDRRTDKLQLAADIYNEEVLAKNVFVVTPKLFQYCLNQSCDPNAVDITRRANSTQYVALRDIRANEEVTADYYNQATLQVYECKSPRCRWTGVE